MGKIRPAGPCCRPDFDPNYGKNERIVVESNKFPAARFMQCAQSCNFEPAPARPPSGPYPLTAKLKPMLFVDMLFVVAVAISFIPILTGYCAQSRGRSFWLWFVLGWVLPLASFFLLFALIAREELDPARRLLGEARQILREAEERAKALKAEK
jgi:hypothetical protein